jgi:hypothetical protein
MDQNTTNAIFNLMQNVVDKLDNISQNLNTSKGTELDEINKSNSEIKELLTKSMGVQDSFFEKKQDLENRIVHSLEKQKAPPITNSYIEYSFFGRESSFKPRTMIIVLFGLVLTWSSIKYLPPYFNAKSILKKEKEDYKLFYDLVYLNQYKNGEEITADAFLNKIKAKDEELIKEYNALFKSYKNEMRKRELEDELKTLDE